MAAGGSRPRPEFGEAEAARWVRDMFGRVAPRYDFLNRLLSLQIDRLWRWRTARLLRSQVPPHAQVADLCCGTGDLLKALESQGFRKLIGVDFSHPMLVRTAEKSQAPLLEADGLLLPFRDASLDLVTIAFGFRNFANYEKGLREALRTLKPGGQLVILEFTTPPSAFTRQFMECWNRFVLAPIGRIVSGQGEAYDYLPASVARFPGAPELQNLFSRVGYSDAGFQYFDVGIVALHWGRKPA